MLLGAGTDDLSGLGGGGKGKGKRGVSEMGSERPWLTVFETMPPQFLNAHGEGQVWDAVSQPQKSGAKYSRSPKYLAERRGVAANRWLQVALNYVKYQEEITTKSMNERTLDPGEAPGVRTASALRSE